MLSIVIPIYNFDISPLIKELHEQITELKKPVEIITFDDHSTSFVNENQNIAKKFNLNYRYLEQNLGRGPAINLLAKAAKYDYLLILDCDVMPKSKSFLSEYLEDISHETDVIYGGRKHEASEKYKTNLRWKYGYYYEDKSVKDRVKNPYLSTLTNNLIIKKELFNQIKFNEVLSNYGHEDTLFAYELKKKHAHIKHIDNPVVHKDIDDNAVFVTKNESSIRNLKTIYDLNLIPAHELQILKTYETLKKLKLKNLFTFFFLRFENKIKDRLASKHNSVFLLNIYKLGYFCKINRS